MQNILKMAAAFACSIFLSAVMAADAPETIVVSSNAFSHHGTIPLTNTAYGDNQSIEISWSGLPSGTIELALICDDPIVNMPQPFVHWVVYNIPASASGLVAGMPSDPSPGIAGLAGLTNGISGVGRPGYFGPRPPVDGKLHAYHFRVYALDTDLDLAEGLNKDQLMQAIEGHILATGMLMGHYQRTE